jgi:chromatin remodeling complex protein RSC6
MTDENSEEEKLPVNINKLVVKIESIKNKMIDQKKNMEEIANELKIFEKSLLKLVKKYVKKDPEKSVDKSEKKKSGFALPTKVSDDLCEFMGQPKGSLIARTEVTKFLNIYIKENALKDNNAKKYIIPNDALWKILGEEARGQVLTHFTIQKYMNKHFQGTYGSREPTVPMFR